MEAYQKTDAYRLFKLQKEKKLKSKFVIIIVLKLELKKKQTLKTIFINKECSISYTS